MFEGLKRRVRWHIFYKQWRKNNVHNNTAPKNFFSTQCVKVGNYTYGELEVHHFGEENKLIIGCFCSIAPTVVFLLKDDHLTRLLSTFPFKIKCLKMDTNEAISKGDIIVDDDVWIGYGAIIMSGVHIGQGAVVAAGAVVTHDISPYAIVGGVPAKVIKYRFTPELITELMKIDYSRLSKEEIERHIQELYKPLKDKSQLDWMPKKDITCKETML